VDLADVSTLGQLDDPAGAEAGFAQRVAGALKPPADLVDRVHGGGSSAGIITGRRTGRKGLLCPHYNSES
jgi:hypothetical protein